LNVLVIISHAIGYIIVYYNISKLEFVIYTHKTSKPVYKQDLIAYKIYNNFNFEFIPFRWEN